MSQPDSLHVTDDAIHGTHCVVTLWRSWGKKRGAKQPELVTVWPKTSVIAE